MTGTSFPCGKLSYRGIKAAKTDLAIVCTSHYGAGNQGEIDYDLIERQYAALCDEVQKSKRPICLHLGAELFGPSNEYILHHVKAQMAHTIAGGNYILVEFAEWSGANETAENISQRMIALAAEGSYHPILAHAERYMEPMKTFMWKLQACIIWLMYY